MRCDVGPAVAMALFRPGFRLSTHDRTEAVTGRPAISTNPAGVMPCCTRNSASSSSVFEARVAEPNDEKDVVDLLREGSASGAIVSGGASTTSQSATQVRFADQPVRAA